MDALVVENGCLHGATNLRAKENTISRVRARENTSSRVRARENTIFRVWQGTRWHLGRKWSREAE